MAYGMLSDVVSRPGCVGVTYRSTTCVRLVCSSVLASAVLSMCTIHAFSLLQDHVPPLAVNLSFSLLFLSLVSTFCLFFFFFQAEDGIRDLIVTGVQTCALPIWRRRAASPHGTRPRIPPSARGYAGGSWRVAAPPPAPA